MGPDPTGLAFLKGRGRSHTQGTTTRGHGEQMAVHMPRREASGETGLPILDPGLPASRLSADHAMPGKSPAPQAPHALLVTLQEDRPPGAAWPRSETEEEFLLQNRAEGGRGGREHGAGDRRGAQLGNPRDRPE